MKINKLTNSKQIAEKMRERFSVARCKAILEKGGKVFLEEEIIMIRDFLINVTDIAYQIFEKQIQAELDQKPGQECKIIHLRQENEDIEKAA